MTTLCKFLVFLSILFAPLSGQIANSDVAPYTAKTELLDIKEDPSSHLFPASQLPIEESSDKFTSELLNMLLTLGMLIAVIFALSYILKRMLNVKTKQENYKSTIKVLEKRALSPKSALYLVEVYGRTLVIAESPTGFNCMTTFDAIVEENDAPPSQEPKSFEKILDKTK
ncbi:MAG: flagellar biosynthetic protein FliO [Parachlamydiales bacterium]|jgi:flagellar protein FliO/FliZ